jgi:uncharacterized protein (DUF2147 family)
LPVCALGQDPKTSAQPSPPTSPVGRWKTVDDATGKVKSVVAIWEENGDQWSGGKILDPDNGKTYKCYIAVEDGGQKLKVRGFIGFSLLGRTQYWLRDE